MKKVGFFQSIHLKFVLIYMLLILIAMQVIGVYFVRELEKSLVKGFQDSLTQQTNLLSYNLKQEFVKERPRAESVDKAINDSIQKLASDRKKDIQEISVIDSTKKLMAISDASKQNKVGRTSADTAVQRVMVQKNQSQRLRKT